MGETFTTKSGLHMLKMYTNRPFELRSGVAQLELYTVGLNHLAVIERDLLIYRFHCTPTHHTLTLSMKLAVDQSPAVP